MGYDKHDVAGRGSGNSRKGTTPKTLLTEIGALDLDVPRDRNGDFEPKIVPKGVNKPAGFTNRIVALYARGMTVRDIGAHLAEMYDVDVSPDLISRVTDGVAEELEEWRNRPLDAVGVVVCEIGETQADAVRTAFSRTFDSVAVHRDLTGRDRFVVATTRRV